MTEITEPAYQDIRNYIQTNWTYMELRDVENTPIIRIRIGGDARAKWVHTANARTLMAEVTVQGSDADIPVPCTIARSVIYKGAVGGEAFSEETITPFYIMDESDRCTITHHIEVPMVQ